MRTVVCVSVPADATRSQLEAVASLHGAIEREEWSSLAATFQKMHDQRVELPEPVKSILRQLNARLRAAGQQAPRPRPVETIRGV